MECRIGCGACCIAPSISSPLPLHPHGKPAGVRCLHLDAENKCELFGRPQRPAICVRFRAEPDMCGDSREQALQTLTALEVLTAPSAYESANSPQRHRGHREEGQGGSNLIQRMEYPPW